jgi:Zn-dependent protease
MKEEMFILSLLIGLICLITAVTIHEFAHAWAADRLGDPTARAEGRLTLDPRSHVDPVGTLLLPFSLLLLSGGAFSYGWGKPTPFDPYNLENPKKDIALISIAGPISNLLLAITCAILLRFSPPTWSIIIIPMVMTNLGIAIFNLIPLGPLDGQKILFGLLPRDLAYEFQTISTRYGTLLLIFFIFPFFGEAPITTLMNPILSFLLRLLLP